MDRITSLVPVDRAVRIAGRDFPVWEARISDLSRLQAWLDAQAGDPAADAFAAYVSPDLPAEAKREAITRAHAEAEKGAPIDGTPEAAPLWQTPAGAVVFLAVALRRGSPWLTGEELAAVARGMTGEQLAGLRRAFFGVSPLRACERLLKDPGPGPAPALSWGEAIDQVAREYGWTYSQIYELTLTEFGNARRGGKPEGPVEIPIPPGKTVAEAAREQCIRYYGKPPEEVWGDGKGGES